LLVPLAPAVTVIQLAVLVADHWQPLVAVTLSVAVPPGAPICGARGATVAAHWVENVNEFESELAAVPPGPTAATSATYVVPGIGQPTNVVVRSTVMVFVESGVGLPRLAVWNGADAPDRYSSSL
jgi:hypothetical protein